MLARGGQKTRLRKRLSDEQGGVCHYCKTPMLMEPGHHPDCVTIDHIIPKSQGGTRIRHNVVGACYTCNYSRADMPYPEFFDLVQREGRPKLIIGQRPSAEWLAHRKERDEMQRIDRERGGT